MADREERTWTGTAGWMMSSEACGELAVEPWPAPVEGAGLLAELRERVERSLVLPGSGATALCLWALATHVFSAFELFPRLLLTSPVKRCGKSRALEVLRLACARTLATSSITPAALYGAVEAWRPTLLIDEGDTFIAGNEALRGVINSGHTRHAAFVLRARAPGLAPVRASTWTPIAIAMIGKPPATVLDRSIALELRRRLPTEPVARLDPREAAAWSAGFQRRAARWALDAELALRSTRPERLADLDDRAADNWEPLLGVAGLAGGSWPELAREAAAALSRQREEDEEPGALLLADLRQLLGEAGAGGAARDKRGLEAARVATSSLIAGLHALEDRPWRSAQGGRPLDGHGLARLLRPYGIRSSSLRAGPARVLRGYRLADLEEAFARYLPGPLQPESATLLHRPGATTCDDGLSDEVKSQTLAG